MIRDPFAVLGVAPNASDTDIKKAYRALSKEWHPDQHPKDAARAEEKFKEIQEAYRQIVEARERGIDPYGPQAQQQARRSGTGAQQQYADYDTSAEAFRQFFQQWQAYSEQMRGATQQSRRRSGSTEADLREAKETARIYLDRGDYYNAMHALDKIDFPTRDAQWYYQAALAHRGMGNNMTALNYAKQAADLEPENGMYAALLRQMQHSGTRYQSQSVNYGGMGELRPPSLWTTICLANLFCNICCRM